MPRLAPTPRPARSLALLCVLLLPFAALAGCADAGDEGPFTEVDEPGIEKWLEDLPDPVERDLPAIEAGDTLRALIVSNSTTYFVHRGEAMGYEFRALREFAESRDMALDARVVTDPTELFRLLNAGEGDVVAARLVPLPAFREVVGLTRGLYETRPTLVQREGPFEGVPLPERPRELVDSMAAAAPADAARPSATEQLRARLIRRPAELTGDTVYLPRGSEYYERIVELQDSVGETLELVELERFLGEESLIRQVAAGELRLTTAQENVADLTDEYFTNLLVAPAIGPAHPVVWAVRENAPELQRALNAWIAEEQDGVLSELYQTYFVDREGYRARVASEYLTSETGRLSPFDSLFVRAASEIGWDWRLLASQAFQESKFDPDARSWAGAMGLLQLMPATAREVGVANPYDPVENVEGAARYLVWLQEQWDDLIPDEARRLPFLLASYNVGLGHVQDARRLAEKYGGDPDDWTDVSYWLLQKSKRRWYRDPVVRYGYARGLEPVTYVALILERYGHYQEFVTAEPYGTLGRGGAGAPVGDTASGSAPNGAG